MTGPAENAAPDAPDARARPGRFVRALLLALLAVIAALAVANEVAAARDRAAPGTIGASPAAEDDLSDNVSLDVAPALADLAERLLAIERECAKFAEQALARTDGVSDPALLFSALEALDLPQSAGVEVADREGRVLAWAGTSVDTSAAQSGLQSGDCAVIVATPSSRRFAVRRTRTVTRPDVPARAICHLPFEVNYPLRNRFFASWSVAGDVRAARRVGAVEVLPPESPEGERLASAFGGDLARLRVAPLSRRAWEEAVDRDLAARRSWLLVAGALVAAALLAWESRRLAVRRPAAASLARAALFAGLRTALALVPAGTVLPPSSATDPARYAHGLPLAFAASPADLLLTCVAALGVAASLRRAAQAGRLRLASPLAGALALAAAASVSRLALGELIEDAVANSRVEFFSDVTVLPQTASAAMFGALLAAGLAAALLVDAAWTWLGPARRPGRGRLLLLALAAGAIAVPLGPDGPSDATTLAVAGGAGFALAAAVLLLDAGTAVRAGIVPLGVALAVFAPLEASLAESLRGLVRAQAEERFLSTDATARLLVERTLDELAASPDLAAALRRGHVPRDLQLRLWAGSPLASRSGGSSIEIEPRDAVSQRVRFGVNLPPVNWLPAAQRLGTVSPTPLDGRGPGQDGRWMVGSRRLVVDGVWVANTWVTLEVRPPSNPGLPELEILGPAAESDTLRAPPLAVSRYTADGRLVETNDADRPGGTLLPPEVRADAVGAEGADSATGATGCAWRIAELPEKELAVAVLPEMQGGVATGFQAFSFETGGARHLALRGARALLFGALVGAAALLATARRWTRGARMRLAYRLVVSYVVVSGLPLLLLGLANRELARQRADETASRELQQAISLLRQEIEAPGIGEPTPLPLRLLEYAEADREEHLRSMAYRVGHHANVFHGTDLLASSDQGLFDTDLLPRRLPGPVTREVLVLQRPFKRFPAEVGGETFDVGYAPIRTAAGDVVGAVSVPLLNQRRLREADVANGMTAILSLYLASLVAAVAVGTWLAARLTRPLGDLTTATQRVAAGDLSRPVPEAGPGELGEVVGAFNRMMRDLAESREKLVRAEKEAAWRDMARQVAHEVKNPLTPMRLAAEHIRRAWRDRVTNFDEVLERGVDLIVRQTESLKRIATSFSDFARLPGRRREPTDVAEILRRVADLYRSTPRLAVIAEFAGELPPLHADPDELQRVLVNLAKNAVEAMDGRTGRLAMRLRRDGDVLVLEVEDDGPGIPDDVLPRLFEPYFSTKTSGTGLGLAICKRAVEDLGGTIAIRSGAGAGTTVTVRIPVSP